MVLSFVFFLYVLVFICMSFPVLLFCGVFFFQEKKKITGRKIRPVPQSKET